ncbi:MAG: hypothetical protein J6T10_22395 [Methanobrevibacter sp.]|nr:hypothetical protein [Methanobrevibacter sp.]
MSQYKYIVTSQLVVLLHTKVQVTGRPSHDKTLPVVTHTGIVSVGFSQLANCKSQYNSLLLFTFNKLFSSLKIKLITLSCVTSIAVHHVYGLLHGVFLTVVAHFASFIILYY